MQVFLPPRCALRWSSGTIRTSRGGYRIRWPHCNPSSTSFRSHSTPWATSILCKSDYMRKLHHQEPSRPGSPWWAPTAVGSRTEDAGRLRRTGSRIQPRGWLGSERDTRAWRIDLDHDCLSRCDARVVGRPHPRRAAFRPQAVFRLDREDFQLEDIGIT